ncbi:ADP-ribosylglycohydrolase family protein [Streptomyces sp. NPDC057336]|uniref:ADP-ribosylglycohydrolase family protein n=1 Tax=Streptomyces sp. NPDC057336 TaxID=3346102 RepID=UPI003641FF50
MASTACIPPAPAPGDAVGLRERARGALLGLAVGDALGAPAENMTPSEIRARWGRITGYVTREPAGTDDTEYAIFSGLLLARYGAALTPAHVETAWHEWIADREEGPFRGAGFSERGTLENLRRGLAAPISAQHRHAWSDGLAMRAAPHGVFAAGRPAEAARLAAIDGSVSHDGEGIYGGQAVAAGVAAAMAGAPTDAVVASALAVVPEDSWTARCLRRAMTAAHLGERAVRSAVVIGGYPWTDLAPEAVALAFGAYAAADGDFTDAVLTAVNMGRDADTTAAVAGALAGATRGAAAIPVEWASAIAPARGSCLPAMAGHHVLEVADLLTRAAAPGEAAGALTAGADGVPGGYDTSTGPRGDGSAPGDLPELTAHAHPAPAGPQGSGSAPRDLPGITTPAHPAPAGPPGNALAPTAPPGAHADAEWHEAIAAGTDATRTVPAGPPGSAPARTAPPGAHADAARRKAPTASTGSTRTAPPTTNTNATPIAPPTAEHNAVRTGAHPSSADSPGTSGPDARDAGALPDGRHPARAVGRAAVPTGAADPAPERAPGAQPGDEVAAEAAP